MCVCVYVCMCVCGGLCCKELIRYFLLNLNCPKMGGTMPETAYADDNAEPAALSARQDSLSSQSLTQSSSSSSTSSTTTIQMHALINQLKEQVGQLQGQVKFEDSSLADMVSNLQSQITKLSLASSSHLSHAEISDKKNHRISGSPLPEHATTRYVAVPYHIICANIEYF
jgi:hypothetical protein